MIAGVVFAILVAILKVWLPLLDLAFLWQALISVPLLYLYFVFMFVANAAFPASVEVRSDRIRVQQGQTCWNCKAEDLRWAKLVVFAPGRIRLRVFYEYRGRLKSRVYGVSQQVDLDRLAERLPVEMVVRDARVRFSQKGHVGRQQDATAARFRHSQARLHDA